MVRGSGRKSLCSRAGQGICLTRDVARRGQEHIWYVGLGAPERVGAFTAADLRTALEEEDMSGPAADLYRQGVNGADFLALSESAYVQDLRVTPFVAKKLLKLRAELLLRAS